jgi:hypothetical protein
MSVTDDLGRGLGPIIVATFITSLGGRRNAFNLSISGWIPSGIIMMMLAPFMRKDEAAVQARLAARSNAAAVRRRTLSMTSMDGLGLGSAYGGAGGHSRGHSRSSSFGTGGGLQLGGLGAPLATQLGASLGLPRPKSASALFSVLSGDEPSPPRPPSGGLAGAAAGLLPHQALEMGARPGRGAAADVEQGLLGIEISHAGAAAGGGSGGGAARSYPSVDGSSGGVTSGTSHADSCASLLPHQPQQQQQQQQSTIPNPAFLVSPFSPFTQQGAPWPPLPGQPAPGGGGAGGAP